MMTMVKGWRGGTLPPLTATPPKIAVAFVQVNTQLILRYRDRDRRRGGKPPCLPPLSVQTAWMAAIPGSALVVTARRSPTILASNGRNALAAVLALTTDCLEIGP